MFANGSRTHEHIESVLKADQSFKKNGNRTHEHVYDNQIMLYYFFIGLLFFIPWSWWWWFSTFEEWQKVPMKLDIVYMDTISLAEYHCTGVWEVYSCTIYERLAFENMFGGEVYFTRPRKKRNLKILYRRRDGGKEGVCIFSPLMVISLAECTLKREI
jgi:hypothetical protein